MRVERVAGIAVLGVLAGLLAWNLGLLAHDWRGARPVDAGDVAPEVRLPRIDGAGEIALSGLRGQVVLIDFWATWCGPCRKTMPDVDRLWRAQRGAGFTVLSIDEEGMGAANKAKAFAASFKPPLQFPIVADDDSAKNAYHVDLIPQLVLVDQAGKIRWTHTGELSADGVVELTRKVAELLAEKQGTL